MSIKLKKFRTANLTEDESWLMVYTLGKTCICGSSGNLEQPLEELQKAVSMGGIMEGECSVVGNDGLALRPGYSRDKRIHIVLVLTGIVSTKGVIIFCSGRHEINLKQHMLQS